MKVERSDRYRHTDRVYQPVGTASPLDRGLTSEKEIEGVKPVPIMIRIMPGQ